MTDLLYSQTEEDLRGAVRDLLKQRCTPADILARCETDQPYDLELWKTLSRELGVTALQVPEAAGGAGASAREAAVVLEELGRAVAPVPYLGHSVLATGALLAAGSQELLGPVAGGEVIATLAVPLAAYPGKGFPAGVTVTGDGTVTGTVRAVADATVADLLVVPATGPDGPELRAVEAAAATVTPVVSLDLTRPVADVSFEDAPSRLVASGDVAAAALDSALTSGAGLLAAERLGIAEWCLDTTVAYLKQRYQFGRPVGSFQALKHRLADLYLQLVTARAAARYATDAGMSPAALYVHFRSKAALLSAIARSGHTRALELVQEAMATTGDPEQRIRLIVETFVAWNAKRHRIARIIQYELHALPEPEQREMRALRGQTDQLGREVSSDGVAADRFAVEDVRTASRAVLSLAIDVARWYTEHTRPSPTELGRQYADLVLRMLRR